MKHFKNEFKIGIELEAFAPISKFAPKFYNDYDGVLYCNTLNNINSDEEDYEPLDEFYGNITKHIDKHYGFGGQTHYDGSVSGFNEGYNGFEWSSPIIDFTPSKINQLKKMLKSLKYDDIHINDSCGFHTHFSYKGINEEDVLWVVMNIAMNKTYTMWLTQFSYIDTSELFTKYTHIEFSNSRYAEKTFLTDLEDAIYHKRYDAISYLLNMEKYRVLRIHPQGTLEWRGPRGFLEYDDGVDAYIQKLYQVVGMFQEILEKKTLLGMTRTEWFDKISECMLLGDYEYNNVLPIRSEKQKRHHTYGILGDFRPNYESMDTNLFSRSRNRLVNSSDVVTQQILKNPLLINMPSISHLLSTICYNLVGMGKLREVIEQVVSLKKPLSVNVQYHMIQKNVTLLPYVSNDIWKYLPMKRLRNLIYRNGPFSQPSDYKIKTIDFLLETLPQVYDSTNVVMFWKWFFETIVGNSSYRWITDYLMTKIDTIGEIFKSHPNISKYPKYQEMIDNILKQIDENTSFDKVWSLINGVYEMSHLVPTSFSSNILS